MRLVFIYIVIAEVIVSWDNYVLSYLALPGSESNSG